MLWDISTNRIIFISALNVLLKTLWEFTADTELRTILDLAKTWDLKTK